MLPVSAVSMCRYRLSEAWQPPGMVTDWVAVSVWVVPYPSNQANEVPL